MSYTRQERVEYLREIAGRLHELAEEVDSSRDELQGVADPGLEMAYALIAQSIGDAVSTADGLTRNPAFA